MYLKLLGLALTLVLLVAAVPPGDLQAKGSVYVFQVDVSSPGKHPSGSADIRLPDGMDDMFEVDDATVSALGLEPDAPGSLPYRFRLHYDFRESGHGLQVREGWFDGHDLVYFREPMNVGPGLWAGGWYLLNPKVAFAFQGAVRRAGHPGAAPRALVLAPLRLAESALAYSARWGWWA
jgi:hypothetical protein